MKRILLLLICTAAVAGAESFFNPVAGYFFDLPPDWELVDQSSPLLWDFMSRDKETVARVRFYAGGEYESVEQLFRDYSQELQARGDWSPFTYNGGEAILARWKFPSAGMVMEGFFTFLSTPRGFYSLISYTGESLFPEKQPLILTVLNSLELEGAKPAPGIISQAFYPYPPASPAQLRISLPGDTLLVDLDREQKEVSQLMIEREAQILAAYSPEDFTPGWQRYYRRIFWDNYQRLAPLAEALAHEWSALGRAEKVQKLVTWVQNYTYERVPLFSDLLSPFTAAIEGRGDCDSRALVLAIILKHWDIEGVLMVSEEYSHAMAAVDLDLPGARFTLGDKSYLVIETTEPVAMGLIGGNVADPAKWTGVSFENYGELR